MTTMSGRDVVGTATRLLTERTAIWLSPGAVGGTVLKSMNTGARHFTSEEGVAKTGG